MRVIQIAHLQISASTVMSGVMVSLTPLFKASIDRPIALNEYAEFTDADDMVNKLNAILAIPKGFPQIPDPRKDCRSIQFPPSKRNEQYVSRAGMRIHRVLWRPESKHD